MRILIISDAWAPQINGVVRTLEATARELIVLGHEVRIEGPQHRFSSFRAPSYPEIRLEFFARPRLRKILNEWQPDFIHIATEGPLGWAMRGICLHHRRPFTTSYHTRFPEYLAARSPRFLRNVVNAVSYAFLRRFHMPAGAVMVSTASIERELRIRKFHRLVRWSRGVNTDIFHPYDKKLPTYKNLPRPILLYVGRVSVEKNLRAFLDLKTTGSKVVIGAGPDLESLRKEYDSVSFLGPLKGEILARHYAAADLFVFPSVTDTFGLVLLEAIACGLRVAAMPAPGPKDIFAEPAASSFAVLSENLQNAVDRALVLPDNHAAMRVFAANYSWLACTRQFVAHLKAPSPVAERRLARWYRRIGEGI